MFRRLWTSEQYFQKRTYLTSPHRYIVLIEIVTFLNRVLIRAWNRRCRNAWCSLCKAVVFHRRFAVFRWSIHRRLDMLEVFWSGRDIVVCVVLGVCHSPESYILDILGVCFAFKWRDDIGKVRFKIPLLCWGLVLPVHPVLWKTVRCFCHKETRGPSIVYWGFQLSRSWNWISSAVYITVLRRYGTRSGGYSYTDCLLNYHISSHWLVLCEHKWRLFV